MERATRYSEPGILDPGQLKLWTSQEPLRQEVRIPSERIGLAQGPGAMKIRRWFSEAGSDPFSEVKWEKRSASIISAEGKSVFEQQDVEVPSFWSATATNVVASKYFKGSVDGVEREHSVRQLIGRVVDTITEWGIKDGYFADGESATTFSQELKHVLVHQYAAFNSPVWFNVGVEKKPQCSACFINSVEDTMDSILDLAKIEGTLFKHGSGTGTNLSSLRSSKEHLSSGGWASGPVSFMRGYDAFAGVIKSGGKTRRAAKMVILNAQHPDIEEFVLCKVKEERKAKALITAGYDGDINGEAYSSVFFQNSNNSVRVSDEFMEKAVKNQVIELCAVTTGEVIERKNARDLLRLITESTHECGDPGLQFDTTINRWHTCSDSTIINASNPCSEYMFIDNSACNLASINLLKFLNKDGSLDVDTFRHVVGIMIIAQDIIVDNAAYPSQNITRNSHDYRPLGLGYANLGALIMCQGYPYHSDEGRAMAAAVTALMTGEAYRVSSELSAALGPFAEFDCNRNSMLNVIGLHRAAIPGIDQDLVPEELLDAVEHAWELAEEGGKEFGFRNAQVTVLAPTGTISFMMDCDTTGIEPDLGLIKYKKMVDGGTIRIVNQSIDKALTKLNYSSNDREAILSYLEDHGSLEGAPRLKDEHLPVFDCALPPEAGGRSISAKGHIRMMGAVQPFISGAISKTVNASHDTTVDEIFDIFVEAWRMGLKSIAIYRDGCKSDQPLAIKQPAAPARKRPVRRRLPEEREAITHKFSIGGHEGYITVGKYEDNSPGEIFVRMAKEGSVVSGLMDSFATATSIMLQYGVPLRVLVDKFSHMRFEPSGATTNRDIPRAKSVLDYIFRWLSMKFLPPDEAELLAQQPQLELPFGTVLDVEDRERRVSRIQSDSPPCPNCGCITSRNGSCYLCTNCGTTTGCS